MLVGTLKLSESFDPFLLLNFTGRRCQSVATLGVSRPLPQASPLGYTFLHLQPSTTSAEGGDYI
jgi:hypothetical protein